MDSSIVSVGLRVRMSRRFLGREEFKGRLRRRGIAAVEAGFTRIV